MKTSELLLRIFFALVELAAVLSVAVGIYYYLFRGDLQEATFWLALGGTSLLLAREL